MAFEITQGRTRKCKSQTGGIKNAYIAPFIDVQRNEIIYDGVSLFQFPQTFIYKFELVEGEAFSPQMNDADGGKFYDINVTLIFNKITAFDNLQFQRFLKQDWFIVIEDKNGNFFLLGFRNGLNCEKIDLSTDGQYKISFSGQEENIPPFCSEIVGTDLIIFEGNQKLMQDGDLFIFQNGDNYIFQ